MTKLIKTAFSAQVHAGTHRSMRTCAYPCRRCTGRQEGAALVCHGSHEGEQADNRSPRSTKVYQCASARIRIWHPWLNARMSLMILAASQAMPGPRGPQARPSHYLNEPWRNGNDQSTRGRIYPHHVVGRRAQPGELQIRVRTGSCSTSSSAVANMGDACWRCAARAHRDLPNFMPLGTELERLWAVRDGVK